MDRTVTDVGPYAICSDCGIELATSGDASSHAQDTVKSTGRTDGITASGHAYRVVNPTPQDQARSRVRFAVEDAITRCMEDLDDKVQSGGLSVEEVTNGLSGYPDFADAWTEWQEEEW